MPDRSVTLGSGTIYRIHFLEIAGLTDRNAKQTFRKCTVVLCSVTIMGADTKIYQAVFMMSIISAPLCQALIVPFCYLRSVYEIRERSSNTYSWTAMITANLLVEIPWSALGMLFFFFCWYWPIGLESSRAGYTVSF
jgi:ABC-type multidrug transport system permease subunit